MSVDLFLRAYFATTQRRSSARCVSMEAMGPSATLEQAQDAEGRHLFALTVMGHLERTQALAPVAVEVLRRYYLSLNPQHVVLLRAGMVGRYTITLGPGESPPPNVGIEADDLQSWCDWAAVARDTGLKSGRTAQKVWWSARQVVQAELERREEVARRSA